MKKFFGSELLFLGIGVGRVYSGVFLPMFLLYYLFFFVPDNVSRKFSSGQVRCLNKISGANFCFMVLVLILCVLVLFCLCFCFIFVFSLPKRSQKNSLDVGSGVFGLSSLPFGFFADVVVLFLFVFFFSSREKAQVVTGHTPTRILCFCPFSFCVSAATGFISRFGRASFLAFCRGAILGPGRFWTRGGRSASLLLVPCFVFPRFVLFCGSTPFLEARVGFLRLAEVGSPSRLFEPKWAERDIRARSSGE